MLFTIYLDKYVVDTLRCFGELSDVVNEILNYCDAEGNGFMDYPRCSNRAGCSRYLIDVRNDNYLELYNNLGATSPRISLRRIIYWFIDNEMYEQWGKEVINNSNNDKVFLLNRCTDILHLIKKMSSKVLLKSELDTLSKLKEDVSNLVGVINEREHS